jgi:NADH-quinone oxidoreductase subunit G
MPTLNVNGNVIEVPDGITLLQACEMAGAEIPRFCYHERLSIAGNCRMCLVEWVGAPKPQASCALSVNDLRPNRDGSPAEIQTNSEVVRKAREGVMEFLLINHPLDCPICDQGGECDLQDQAMSYGVDASRFDENKRAVEEKDIGALVKTTMTRCIHCTRCIRFVTEVAGVPELGATGRGEDMEITTYLEKAMSSELQGNVIDLCPVGALTSKPYAFSARPWELHKTETIDVMDAVGSNIRIDTRGREVMRVMPRLHEDVNEEWISDKSRFIWDGLRTQRLDQPYIRKNGKLEPASWSEAFTAISKAVAKSSPRKMAAIAGDLAAAEDMFALKSLMDNLGVANIDCRQDGARLDPALGRGSYIFNSTIAGIEDADALLLIGCNPREEAAIINARIRKRWRRGNFPIGVIGGLKDGANTDLTYDYEYLGAGPETLSEVRSGKHSFFKQLKAAARPMIIVGQGALARTDGATVLSAAATLAVTCKAATADWNGFNVLHNAAGRVAGLDLGFVPGPVGRDVESIIAGAKAGDVDFVYLLGADEIPGEQFGKAFVVYQGTHGDQGAHRADVILPGAAYSEKSGIYVNTEGRAQMAYRGAFPPGDAREDWAILRALSDVLGAKLPFDSLDQLRTAMFKAVPHLVNIDGIEAGLSEDIGRVAKVGGRLGKDAFEGAVKDFYLTNPIARASRIMAGQSLAAKSGQEGATGTDG